MGTRTVKAQYKTEMLTDSRSSTPESELDSPISPIRPLPLRSVRQDILSSLTPFQLKPDDISDESIAIGNGTFGDVTKARYNHPQRGRMKVAIKRLRIIDNEEVVAVGTFLP